MSALIISLLMVSSGIGILFIIYADAKTSITVFGLVICVVVGVIHLYVDIVKSICGYSDRTVAVVHAAMESRKEGTISAIPFCHNSYPIQLLQHSSHQMTITSIQTRVVVVVIS